MSESRAALKVRSVNPGEYMRTTHYEPSDTVVQAMLKMVADDVAAQGLDVVAVYVIPPAIEVDFIPKKK